MARQRHKDLGRNKGETDSEKRHGKVEGKVGGGNSHSHRWT